MVKGRSTTVIGVRVSDSVYTTIRARAEKLGMSVCEYCRQVLEREVTRSHHKKPVNTIKRGSRYEWL